MSILYIAKYKKILYNNNVKRKEIEEAKSRVLKKISKKLKKSLTSTMKNGIIRMSRGKVTVVVGTETKRRQRETETNHFSF